MTSSPPEPFRTTGRTSDVIAAIEATLRELLAFADDVQRHVVGRGEQDFLSSRRSQLVAEALLHRLGEAVSRLPAPFRSANPQVDWAAMKGMRNVVAHEYGFIDYGMVWRALAEDLPRDTERI